jgi:hypothetical protein
MKLNPSHLPFHRLMRSVRSCAGLAALLLSANESRASDVPKACYETSYQSITQISANLSGALDAKRRQQIPSQPVSLGEGAAPRLIPMQGADKGGDSQTVQVSAGFVEFINQLSHAKAIEESEKGFLKKYAAALARETGEKPIAPLPSTAGHNPWDADTINYQVGNFNQMAGSLIAVQLAHHYLGHYKKYSSQLASRPDQPAPINAAVTEKEWRDAVLKGAKNALDCGYGVDGMKCAFDCLGSMPNRPPWAAYFLHPKADVSKINRDLTRLERDFFLVGK